MTLEEIKEQVAYEYEWIDWICFLSDCPDHEKDVVIDEVAERYAQSQTQELQEQNTELVRLLEELSKTTSGSRFLKIKHEAKELLTKYNHLKSNTNETDKI